MDSYYYYLKYADLKMKLLARARWGLPNCEYWWKHWVKLEELIKKADEARKQQ